MEGDALAALAGPELWVAPAGRVPGAQASLVPDYKFRYRFTNAPEKTKKRTIHLLQKRTFLFTPERGQWDFFGEGILDQSRSI